MLLLMGVVVMVVVMVMVVVTVLVVIVQFAVFVFRDCCFRARMVVFAQTADGYAGVRPPGAAHAFRWTVMVVVLARRDTAALDQEQRTSVRVQQRADVLQDLVAQRPHVQLVAYVLHLCKRNNNVIIIKSILV